MLVHIHIRYDKKRYEHYQEDQSGGHHVDPDNLCSVVNDEELEVSEHYHREDHRLEQVAEGYQGSYAQLLGEFPGYVAWDDAQD